MSACPVCGQPLEFVQQYGQWYCGTCKAYRQPATPEASHAAATSPPIAVAGTQAAAIWFLNYYRIRKKVLALTNQYWIEDREGKTLGYSKQKMFRIKEQIRIFTDDSMTKEVFRIQQTQVLDVWGTFAVTDAATNQVLGYVRRKALMSGFVRDEYEVRDGQNRLIGKMAEGTGRGLLRKFVPGGSLVPEQVKLLAETGQLIAAIDQQFKVVGDIWEISVNAVPPQFDRRVILACALLMGMIERQRK